MNQKDKNCSDMYGVFESDKQIYTALNQPQPGDSNKHIYYELHQPIEQRESTHAATDSIRKPQLVSKIAIFQSVVSSTVNDTILIGSTDCMMFIKKAPAIDDKGCLESITESVMSSLHKLVNQQLVYSKNNTNYKMRLIEQSTENTMNLIQQSSINSTQQLINIVSTLNNLKGTSTSIAGVVDDILLVVEELLGIQNASVLFNSI